LFSSAKPGVRDHFEISRQRGRIVSENVNWIHLAEDSVQWWTLVNNITVPSGSTIVWEFLD
jgi:hypothetical protein